MEGIVGMRTSDDQIPRHIGNLPIDNLISLYYVLWIILVRIDFCLILSLHMLKKYKNGLADLSLETVFLCLPQFFLEGRVAFSIADLWFALRTRHLGKFLKKRA
jgi:hypothetical protein